jgi:hypothetical protein
VFSGIVQLIFPGQFVEPETVSEERLEVRIAVNGGRDVFPELQELLGVDHGIAPLNGHKEVNGLEELIDSVVRIDASIFDIEMVARVEDALKYPDVEGVGSVVVEAVEGGPGDISPVVGHAGGQVLDEQAVVHEVRLLRHLQVLEHRAHVILGTKSMFRVPKMLENSSRVTKKFLVLVCLSEFSGETQYAGDSDSV